jgi:hypothetical protein
VSEQLPVVVAFLQNLWVKDPERAQRAIDKHGRRHMIRNLIFVESKTGKRLRQAFGDMVDQIVWEESTKEIASNPQTICFPDPEHIKEVLETYQPLVVIAFGTLAHRAVPLLCKPGTHYISSPHPAARMSDVPIRLHNVAYELRETLKRLSQK